jgi:hypothetical protein
VKADSGFRSRTTRAMPQGLAHLTVLGLCRIWIPFFFSRRPPSSLSLSARPTPPKSANQNAALFWIFASSFVLTLTQVLGAPQNCWETATCREEDRSMHVQVQFRMGRSQFAPHQSRGFGDANILGRLTAASPNRLPDASHF